MKLNVPKFPSVPNRFPELVSFISSPVPTAYRREPMGTVGLRRGLIAHQFPTSEGEKV